MPLNSDIEESPSSGIDTQNLYSYMAIPEHVPNYQALTSRPIVNKEIQYLT